MDNVRKNVDTSLPKMVAESGARCNCKEYDICNILYILCGKRSSFILANEGFCSAKYVAKHN